MRRLNLFLIGTILVILSLVSSAHAAEKLGYVDLGKLFDEYSKTKDYDGVLEEKQKAYENEREKAVNDVKQLQDKMNLLNEKEKEAKKAVLEEKVKALQDFDRNKTQDLRKERDEKMKDILKDIENAIAEMPKKKDTPWSLTTASWSIKIRLWISRRMSQRSCRHITRNKRIHKASGAIRRRLCIFVGYA